jgi:hypothetical protein
MEDKIEQPDYCNCDWCVEYGNLLPEILKFAETRQK